MVSKKQLLLAFITISLTAVFLMLYFPQSPAPFDSREQYEAFLREHPYYKARPGAVSLKKGDEEENKRDRPDLRMQQEFLMTMDPSLRRPTPEKLSDILRSVNARTMGTLPGESTAPWVERGPNNVGGRTRALMWDPNDATGKKVWAGGVSGGLWVNTDISSATSSWTAVNNFWKNLAISSIAYDPNATQTFYVGTGEGWYNGDAVRGQGIWKSTDGGANWTQLSATTDFFFVNDIAVRNVNGTSEIYAAVVRRSNHGVFAGNKEGLYKSVDGGATFTQVLPNISGKNYPPGVSDIEIGADGTLWVGTHFAAAGGGGGRVMKSTDGTAWSTVYTAAVGDLDGRVELAVTPAAAAVVYALIENDAKIFEMKRTATAGATWVNMAKPDDDDNGIDAADFTRGQAYYDLIAQVDPAKDSTVIIGGINLHRSTDAGQTWKQISKWSDNANMGSKPYSYVHADQHAIVFKPGSSSEVIFGNDGGVFWTNNVAGAALGSVISARNTNYNVTQFYTAAIHPDKAKHYFLAGAQDNGTQRFQTAGVNATDDINGGDGAWCFIDQTNGSNQIASYVYNDYTFTADSWATRSSIASDDATGHFINPADYDDEQNVLYSAATDATIGRFVKGSTGFTRNDLSVSLGTKASHLRVSPHTRTSTTLFVGTAAGRLFKITKANTGSAVTTEITGANFPQGWISCVEVGQDENHLLVTFSNYGVVSVWYTADGGTTWMAKEGDLPDMPVRWALFNPTNFDEVILATEMGIWGTKTLSAASVAWSQFSNGLANVRVDMLQMRDADYEVIAATHGRGLYSSSIFASQATLSANFVAVDRKIEKTVQVQFADRSKGATAWEWTFTGGQPATSTQQNPTVTYAADGVYTVKLVAKNGANSSTKEIVDYIRVGPVDDGPLEAKFTSDATSVVQGETVSYSSTSTGQPESLIWFFEGGTPSASTSPNPKVKYESTGSFDVELIVFREGEQHSSKKTDFVTVTADASVLEARFKVNTPNVFVGNQVKFTETSLGGATGYSWTFPGGSPASSTSPNPVVTYSTPGKFDVTLQVTKGTETSVMTKQQFIGVYASAGIEYADKVIDSFYSGANTNFTSFYGGTASNFPVSVSPDVVLGNTSTFLSLPIGTYVTVAFTDNQIINAPGQHDIFIKELDGQNEYANVYVSSDQVNFTFIGTAVGTNSNNVATTFDLESINFQEPVVAIKVVGLDLGGASPGYDLLSVSGIAGAVIGNDPPAAPTNLTVEALPSEAMLSWSDNSIDESSFVVERSTDGTTFAEVKVLAANTTAYTNGGLTEGTAYHYRVKATNKNGGSGYSNVVQITTPEYAVTAPSALQGVASSSTTVTIDWTDNSNDEDSFDVQRSLDNDQFVTLQNVDADVTSFEDSGLLASTTYFYRIKGKNASGESPYTETLEIKTLDSLERPAEFEVETVTGRKVTLKWVDKSSRETGFVIQRAPSPGAFQTIGEADPDAEIFTDTQVAELTTYRYRMYAVNGNAEKSANTAVVTATTLEKTFSDLAVTSLTVPATQSAKTIPVAATVSNLSEDSSEDGFELSFYLSQNEIFSTTDHLLGTVQVAALDGLAEKNVSETFDMVILPAGEYFVIAVADPEKVIDESDETNNEEIAAITLTDVLSVSDELKLNTRVYPNPVGSWVDIEVPAEAAYTHTLQLSDLSGRVVRQQQVAGAVSRLNTAGLPKGVYILTVSREGGQATYRIIKQ